MPTLRFIPDKDKKYANPIDTSDASHHAAFVAYPWKVPYPIDTEKVAADQLETLDQDVINMTSESGVDSRFGVTYFAIHKKKEIGGTLVIDVKGVCPKSFLTVGTWVVLVTSAVGPIKVEKSNNLHAVFTDPKNVIRFIGQVYSVNSKYFADASGTVRKAIKITVRDWAHVLHTHVMFHELNITRNLTDLATASEIKEAVEKVKGVFQTAQVGKVLGTNMFSVFEKPELALRLVNAMSLTNDAEKNGLPGKDLDAFSDAVTRLPIIPDKLLKDVFNKSSSTRALAWAEIFLKVVSGVQKWEKISGSNTPDSILGTVGSISNLESLSSWLISERKQAKRPLSYFDLRHLLTGVSLAEYLGSLVRNSGGAEFYAENWFCTDGKKLVIQPVLVFRDIPFSLLRHESESKKSGIPWTIYENLPRHRVNLANIINIDITQTIENSPNFIYTMPMSRSFNDQVTTTELVSNARIRLSHQNRFGGIPGTYTTMDVYSIISEEETLNAVSAPKTANKTGSDQQTSNKKKTNVNIHWYRELQNKHLRWYGDDYRYPSGTILVKDSNYRFCVGNNIEFNLIPGGPTFLAHIVGIDIRYTVSEAGLLTNQTYVYFQRMGVIDVDSKDCVYLPPGSISDILAVGSNQFPIVPFDQYLVKGFYLGAAQEVEDTRGLGTVSFPVSDLTAGGALETNMSYINFADLSLADLMKWEASIKEIAEDTSQLESFRGGDRELAKNMSVYRNLLDLIERAQKYKFYKK